MARAAGGVLGVGALAMVALVGYITVAGNRVDVRHADCVIVPGARVLADGVPGPVFTARVENAVRLYREGWVKAIIFTGGQGESGWVESEVGRRLAVKSGLSPEALFVETKSHTTLENFLFARDVMRQQGFKTCLVSTDPFHEPRCLRVATDIGIEAYPAPTFESPAYLNLGTRAWYTLRECAAWGRYVQYRLLLKSWPPREVEPR